MSMISSLIDELNKSADEWNGSNMFELARMCRSAAYTIWELRESVHRERAENAKLRELVVDMLPFAEAGMDDSCVTRRCCMFEQCEDVIGVKCAIEQHMLDRMRELGIEVDW